MSYSGFDHGKQTNVNAHFLYDGDGKRVKGEVNGQITYYVGDYYELQGTTVRKYYSAGSQRLAMRKDNTIFFLLLTDHLGGTSITVEAPNGTQSGAQSYVRTGELRYSAWGETRYSFGVTPTNRRFTGQSAEPDLGIYFYGARWYDGALGRFLSPDSYVPESQGVQAWDRYAYVNNNPVNATDPTGHMEVRGQGGDAPCDPDICWAKDIGSVSTLPYYPVSPPTYRQNAEETYMEYRTADVDNPAFSVTKPIVVDGALGKAGAAPMASDWAIYWRNSRVGPDQSGINVTVYYEEDGNSLNVKALRVQNPANADVTVASVQFSYSSTPCSGSLCVTNAPGSYPITPGPAVVPSTGYYSGVGVAQPNRTTTISLDPSRHSGNPHNLFRFGQNVSIRIYLLHALTGMRYPVIEGSIP